MRTLILTASAGVQLATVWDVLLALAIPATLTASSFNVASTIGAVSAHNIKLQRTPLSAALRSWLSLGAAEHGVRTLNLHVHGVVHRVWFWAVPATELVSIFLQPPHP